MDWKYTCFIRIAVVKIHVVIEMLHKKDPNLAMDWICTLFDLYCCDQNPCCHRNAAHERPQLGYRYILCFICIAVVKIHVVIEMLHMKDHN
jgi:hypothetical protein